MSSARQGRRTALLCGALVLAVAVPSYPGRTHAASPPSGNKYAVLVGVHQYDKNELHDLNYAEDDVEALAEVLRQSGYKRVLLLTQTVGAKQARFLPMAVNIRNVLKGVLEDRAEGDTVLVALAGHGVQFQGEDESYFCPMDAKLADKSTLVSLSEVYRDLEKSEAGTRILLADCCRNDPRSDESRAVDRIKLESVTRPQKALPPGGVAALFSCSAGEKAYENTELKHGVFFHFVIEGLKGKADLDGDGQVDLDELVRYAKQAVPDFVKDAYGDGVRQMPELVGKTRGLVALAGVPTAAPVDTTRTTTPPDAPPPPVDTTTNKGKPSEDVPLLPHNAYIDTYAAIAYSPETGRYGYGFRCSSKEEAGQEAIRQCHADDARALIYTYNAWCALAVGDNGAYGSAWGATPEAASLFARLQCLGFGATPDHCRLRVRGRRSAEEVVGSLRPDANLDDSAVGPSTPPFSPLFSEAPARRPCGPARWGRSPEAAAGRVRRRGRRGRSRPAPGPPAAEPTIPDRSSRLSDWRRTRGRRGRSRRGRGPPACAAGRRTTAAPASAPGPPAAPPGRANSAPAPLHAHRGLGSSSILSSSATVRPS